MLSRQNIKAEQTKGTGQPKAFQSGSLRTTKPRIGTKMQQQQPEPQQTVLPVSPEACSDSEPEFAYKVLQWSITKIGECRKRKGGIDLRQNLLLANTLCKARDRLIAAKMQQQQKMKQEQQKLEQEQQQQEQQQQQQEQQQQQQQQQQHQQQEQIEKQQQQQKMQQQQQRQLRRQKLKRSVSIAIDDEAASKEEVKRPRQEAAADSVQVLDLSTHSSHQKLSTESQLGEQTPSIAISIIPLSPAEAAQLSRSQSVVSVSLGYGVVQSQQQQQPFISWTPVTEPARGGCVVTCA